MMGALAMDNARKLRVILTEWRGEATLYRTCVAGPSGQRSDIAVGVVRYAYDQTGRELEVLKPDRSEVVGHLSRSTWGEHAGQWIVRSYCDEFPDWEFNRLLGWAGTAALGTDVLVNGVHAATANHDHARTSRASWTGYVPVD